MFAVSGCIFLSEFTVVIQISLYVQYIANLYNFGKFARAILYGWLLITNAFCFAFIFLHVSSTIFIEHIFLNVLTSGNQLSY